MKSPWRNVLVAVAGVFLLFVLFTIVEHLRGRAVLAREKAAVRNRGEILDVAKLTPPAPRAEDNGAMAFLAAASIPGGGAVVPNELPNAWSEAGPGKAIPRARYREWRSSDRSRTNLITAEQLAEDINAASERLEQIRAALRRPALVFFPTYSLRNLLLPHLAQGKATTQWLRAASLNALFNHDLEASLIHLEALAALARKQTDERLLISQLVGIAEAHIGVTATWEALQSPGWNDAQLARLQAAWTGESYLARMGKALEMERAMGNELFEQMNLAEFDTMLTGAVGPWTPANPAPPVPTNVDEVLDYLGWMVRSTGSGLRRLVYLPYWRVAWKDQDHARLLRQWRIAIDAAHRRPDSPVWQALDTNANRGPVALLLPTADPESDRGLYDRLRFLVSDMVGGYEWRAIRKACEADLLCGVAVTAIALQRHQLRHGHLPATLEALVPEFLPEVPLDPLAGKPLCYRLQPDGHFLLYSVGDDGVDDGGDASMTDPKRRLSVFQGRDKVWPMPATDEEAAEAERVRLKRR